MPWPSYFDATSQGPAKQYHASKDDERANRRDNHRWPVWPEMISDADFRGADQTAGSNRDGTEEAKEQTQAVAQNPLCHPTLQA